MVIERIRPYAYCGDWNTRPDCGHKVIGLSGPRTKYGIIGGLLSFLECEMEEISPINYYIHYVKHHF